jgi:hypothetical protein
MAVEYIWIQGENGATMMAKQPQADSKGLFGPEGMTFKDALDIINPLQQIPIVSSIYRELTGDTIKPGARIIGGAIYGLGVGGIIAAAAANSVEETTGHDPGGTVIAMVKGQSLGDQMQTAQAARDKASHQLASTQYFSGGADPIDPTSLPPGAHMVDVPAAAPASQLAALPADPVSTVAAALPASPVEVAPVAAALAPVSVSPLAPLAPAIHAVANPPANTRSNQSANQGVGAPTGDAGLIPEVPTLPPGATGLSAVSHLPTAGSIMPPGAALTAAGVQTSLSPTAAATHSPLSIATPNLPPAVAKQATQTATAAAPANAAVPAAPTAIPTGGFPVPARSNNVVPRMPVATTPMNIGVQPLALSTPERHPVDTTKTSATTPAPTSAAEPAQATAPVAPTTASAAPIAASMSGGPLPSPTLPAAQVPEAMMRALDKYDALMRSRRNANGQVDQSL